MWDEVEGNLGIQVAFSGSEMSSLTFLTAFLDLSQT